MMVSKWGGLSKGLLLLLVNNKCKQIHTWFTITDHTECAQHALVVNKTGLNIVYLLYIA